MGFGAVLEGFCRDLAAEELAVEVEGFSYHVAFVEVSDDALAAGDSHLGAEGGIVGEGFDGGGEGGGVFGGDEEAGVGGDDFGDSADGGTDGGELGGHGFEEGHQFGLAVR